MDWVKREGKEVSELNIETLEQVGNVEYTQAIKNGPNSVGFDYYYGISASLDMVPYAFIENDRVTTSPNEEQSYPMTLGRDDGKMTRKGPGAPGFTAIGVLPALVQKSVEYIGKRAGDAKAGETFFSVSPTQCAAHADRAFAGVAGEERDQSVCRFRDGDGLGGGRSPARARGAGTGREYTRHHDQRQRFARHRPISRAGGQRPQSECPVSRP